MGEISIELCNEDNCTGCGACYATCPTNSIEMISEGHLHKYPRINANSCIGCKKCEHVCPMLNFQSSNKSDQRMYYTWNKNIQIRSHSTSGGAANAIAKQAIADGFLVYGVTVDSDWTVIHKVARNEIEINKFSGSKYVQSESAACLKEIGVELQKGNKIFFFGAPCQTDAVRRLYHKYVALGQLLTCEIICHGVNSPRVWKDFVCMLESINKSTLSYYNFRSKSHGWQTPSGGGNLRINYKFLNGRDIDQPSWKNLFHCWFSKHYMLRPSCLSCRYRNENRNSDLTIGDFWNIERVTNISKQELHDGVSAVITSTKVGAQFFCRCTDLYSVEVPFADGKNVLKGFVEKKSDNQRKEEILRMKRFESEYLEKGIVEMSKKYPIVTLRKRIKDFIYLKLHLK